MKKKVTTNSCHTREERGILIEEKRYSEEA